MYKLPLLTEICDCRIVQHSHAVRVGGGHRCYIKNQKPKGLQRFSPLCDSPETTVACGDQKTLAG